MISDQDQHYSTQQGPQGTKHIAHKIDAKALMFVAALLLIGHVERENGHRSVYHDQDKPKCHVNASLYPRSVNLVAICEIVYKI